MNVKNEIVVKIPSHYVGDDCVQVMFAYRGSMAVINPTGIKYHDQVGYENINHYLEDERRKKFPYSNIPMHNGKILFRKYKYVNQLLDFDTPYLRLSSQGIYESFAVKDGGEAFLVNRGYLGVEDERLKYLSRKELEEMFTTVDGRQKYILHNGKLSHTLIFPTNKELCSNPNFMFAYLKKKVDVEFVSDVLLVDIDGKDMTMQQVSVNFESRPDSYRVSSKNVPINKYTSKQVKAGAKACILREPTIKASLNPNISLEEIQSANTLVKKIK